MIEIIVMENRHKSSLKVRDKVVFHSGNYEGLEGEVTNVDWKSQHPKAIFGIWHEVKLSNGEMGNIEKSEHWHFK
jgi:ribosomal protein L24